MQLQSNLRAFLFVGVAYFLVAVVLPLVMIFVLNWDPTAKAAPNFNDTPVFWGLVAGLAGAIGALVRDLRGDECRSRGAIYVAPLVFGGAPRSSTPLRRSTIFAPAKDGS